MQINEIRSALKQSKADRIQAIVQMNWLVSRIARRSLAVIVVIASWAYFATLLIPIPYFLSKKGNAYVDMDAVDKSWLFQNKGSLQLLAFLILIASAFLLRQSLKKIVQAPEEGLDELQLANRNWAFRTGYLVVRRIGLGVLTTVALIKTSMIFGRFGHDITNQLNDYLTSLTALNAMDFYFRAILLLVLMAYLFPLVFLAWRESKFTDALPQAEPIVLSPAATIAKSYFTALSWVVGLLLIWAGPTLTWDSSGGALNQWVSGFYFTIAILILYIGAPGGVFLYGWASVEAVRIIKAHKRAHQGRTTFLAGLALAFFTLTQLLGVGVFYSLFFNTSTSGFGQGIAMIFGCLMIPVQAMSMRFVALLDTGDELGK